MRTFTKCLWSVLPIASAVLLVSVTGQSNQQSPNNAAELFNKNCATCHGKDGRAKTFKSKMRYHAQDLTDPEFQKNVTDERIFNVIVKGKGKMPAFGGKLNEQEVESLVKYVRDFGK